MDIRQLTTAQLENMLRQELTFPGLQKPKFAILIPVVWGGGEPELLLEVRAPGISQSGDPCFPGGHIEPGETPAQAAARELGEELSIPVSPSALLGQLPTVQTPLGILTDVFVCTVTPEQADAICSNPSEVAEVLRVPVSFFLQNPRAADYTVRGNVIWGMTAGAIHHFCTMWNRLAKAV